MVVIAKGLPQHAIETQFSGIAELLDSDRHGLVAGLRLGPIGAEQTIPPGKIEAEIAVGLGRQDRMVHAVHVGRDDQPAYHPVRRCGRRTLPWLNIEVALSSTSKISTATAGAPSAATTPSLIAIDSRISMGWKRAPVVTSISSP